MQSTGAAAALGFFAVLTAIVAYGVMFYIVWKFYQMLSKINDNIAGIKRALEHNPPGQ